MTKKSYIIRIILSVLVFVCGQLDYAAFIIRFINNDFSWVTWVDLAVSTYLIIVSICSIIGLVRTGYKKK